MSLATKHRPKDLENFWGNEETVKALTTVLNRPQEDIPHCFLFTGQAGGGKTTLARIVATMLDCHPSEFKEMNAASIRGIDAIREIEKECLYNPMKGSARVWLFDEVHQYRGDTQEAMLKMLEEAPDHAYFIMCTTDPQKLKDSLKRRAMPFKVSPLIEDDMSALIDDICEYEGKKPLPDKVVHKLCIESKGSAGMALQLLDKIIDLEQKEMIAAIEKAASEESKTIELCQGLIKREGWTKLCTIVSGLDLEPEQARAIILGYANKVLLNPKSKSSHKQAAFVIGCFSENFFYSGHAGLSLACYLSVTD